MDTIISGLFLIASLLCAAIVIQFGNQGNVMLCGLFVFFFITMIMSATFWKIGKEG